MVQLNAGSNLSWHILQPAPLWVFFGEVAELFQPCFTSATQNMGHEGLGASLSARHQRIPARAGSFGAAGEVCGDGDGHGMASGGLQSAGRCWESSGDGA